MIIYLKKFGTTLISRQFGKEAYSAFLPSLKNIKKGEIVEIEFAGINTFSPSWGDEFLTPLFREHQKRLILKKSDNLSVKATIKTLEEVNKIKFSLR